MNSEASSLATTHWSVVLTAMQGESPAAAAALEELCRGYWYPLYAFVRRQGHGPEDAEDLLQGFFARLLEKDFLRQVDRSKGRFRSFLLAALKHFFANEWDKAHARKRGGQVRFVPLETEDAALRYGEEPATEATPETLYEQRWACVLLERMMQRLAADSLAEGKAPLFEALKPFLAGEDRAETYAQLAVSNLGSAGLRATPARAGV
jgi:RNA polymerase sigma-70 factor (ECF subfamily)